MPFKMLLKSGQGNENGRKSLIRVSHALILETISHFITLINTIINFINKVAVLYVCCCYYYYYRHLIERLYDDFAN